jgi:hypothetical protein
MAGKDIRIGGPAPADIVSPSGPTSSGQLVGYDHIDFDSSSTSSRMPEKLNGLLPTYFKFELKRTPYTTYFCQSVNLPSISVNTVRQPTGRFVDIMHTGMPEYSELTVQFLVDEDMTNWLEIYNWLISTTTDDNTNDYEETKNHYSDATLIILNSAMKPNVKVQFKNILPREISGVEFDSTVVGTEPLIATANFTYTTYDITKL